MTEGNPSNPEKFQKTLKELRRQREHRKSATKARRRRGLGRLDRQVILAKTGGRCHICGGEIAGRWQADHVLAHSGGGSPERDNYLPAHALCNNYRWDYLAEEFQLILKLGVWARTQIERQTTLGKGIVASFAAHEARRVARHRKD